MCTRKAAWGVRLAFKTTTMMNHGDEALAIRFQFERDMRIRFSAEVTVFT
jgi:hypothetical protein